MLEWSEISREAYSAFESRAAGQELVTALAAVNTVSVQGAGCRLLLFKTSQQGRLLKC